MSCPSYDTNFWTPGTYTYQIEGHVRKACTQLDKKTVREIEPATARAERDQPLTVFLASCVVHALRMCYVVTKFCRYVCAFCSAKQVLQCWLL